VAYSPDGKRLASASRDGTVRVWETRAGQETLKFTGHAKQVLSVAFAPGGDRLASAGDDGRILQWDAVTGRLIHTMNGPGTPVQHLAFSPNGRWLASASGGYTAGGHTVPGEVKIWDAESGQEIRTLAGQGVFRRISFAADSRQLAIAGTGDTVTIWDAEDGQRLGELRGHTKSVLAVAISPDGRRVASAGFDRTVRVWSTEAGQELLSLAGHAQPVYDLAFSPDGLQLASASYDGAVKIWDARPLTPSMLECREARGLLSYLKANPPKGSSIAERIKTDATVSPPVREGAIDLLR
jgi:WD40 repeat protein